MSHVKAPAAPLFTALFYAGRARMDLGFAASAFVLFSGGVGVCWLPATLPTNCAVLRDEEKAAMLTREQEQEIKEAPKMPGGGDGWVVPKGVDQRPREQVAMVGFGDGK